LSNLPHLCGLVICDFSGNLDCFFEPPGGAETHTEQPGQRSAAYFDFIRFAKNHDKPLSQRKRGSGKHGSVPGAKLPTAILALHKVSDLNLSDSHTAAMNAHGGITSPTDFPHIIFANFQVRKVADSIEQGFWQSSHFMFSVKSPAPANTARGWTKKSFNS
jgi:hypothetical protein